MKKNILINKLMIILIQHVPILYCRMITHIKYDGKR